jgi:hypothetical protein
MIYATGIEACLTTGDHGRIAASSNSKDNVRRLWDWRKYDFSQDEHLPSASPPGKGEFSGKYEGVIRV